LVSKVKSAKEKKALSLKKDRRNMYGENTKSSRRGIRLGKQRSHMNERRTAAEILRRVKGSEEQTDSAGADALTKTALLSSKRKAFKKSPDTPLGVVVKRKLARREKQDAGTWSRNPRG
jgi:hypothetical protein